MKAREPDVEGFAEHDGLKLFYEIHGEGHRPTVVLMSNAPLTLRHWKAQIPYLARHFRVIAFDAPGGGRADTTLDPAAYTDDRQVAYALAVLDATGTERAVLVTLSDTCMYAFQLAITHPERVLGVATVSPAVPALTPPHPHRTVYEFDAELDSDEGWAKMNRRYWARDWPGFAAWASEQDLPEPHSTKQLEDMTAWRTEIDVRVVLAETDAELAEGYTFGGASAGSVDGPSAPGLSLVPKNRDEAEAFCRAVPCPVLVIQGELDVWRPVARGMRIAELTRGTFVLIGAGGSVLHGRHPVEINLLLRDFVQRVAARGRTGPTEPRTEPTESVRRIWTRALARPRRALFLSSPIGLGHALRDVAIATELRTLRPDLEVSWLTQHPVTAVLEARGERVHPASAALANESAHLESEATEHDLAVFSAFRDMDEILVANFHVFHDVITDEPYDVVIGDESWDVDHFLHENPELKAAAFVWLTDFVGWLPMPEAGEREAFLTADYNAEMVEHVERFPTLRDRSIFVGDPDDLPDGTFGPGLPEIRAWTEEHYAFAGYVSGFDPRSIDREAARAELGYAPGERVCLVTVGGSGVGSHLLRKVLDAAPEATAATPGLRVVVVAGPRIDPASLPTCPGVEVHGFLDGLGRHMAAADVAIVQGGLTTTMELTALGTPFVYVPLRGHFEQQLLVPRRLARYGAGIRTDYDRLTPEALAGAIATAVAAPRPAPPQVGRDGAVRAAALIAELV